MEQILLKTATFRLVLVPGRIVDGDGFVEYRQELSFESELGHARFCRDQCRLYRMDLHVLVRLLREYLGSDGPHSFPVRSGAFYPTEFDFKLELFEGHIDSWASGYLQMQWLMYGGGVARGLQTMYAGCEGVVELPEFVRWVDELDELYSRVGRIRPPA